MEKKIKSFIGNKKGEYGSTYIFAVFIIIFFAIFNIVFGKIYMIMLNGQRVKESMKEACLYVMTSNWDELYSSIREGYAGAYNFEGEELIDPERVYDIMQKELNTVKRENEYIKYGTNNEVVYKYYNIKMNINNTGFRNTADSYNIDLSLTYEASINLNRISYPIIVDLKHKARWRAKYQ